MKFLSFVVWDGGSGRWEDNTYIELDQNGLDVMLELL